MKTVRILCLFVFAISLNTVMYAQNKVYSKVKVYIKQTEDIKQIASLGIPVDGVYIKKNEYIIGEYAASDIEKLRTNGYQVEVLIADVSKFYEERNKKSQDSLSNKKKDIKDACFFDKYPTPHYFSLGSVGGYYSYQEIMTQLDSMQQRFPNLVSVKQALSGTTIEGRQLWYVKISNNPQTVENKPRILYSALTHAREPMGMQQLFYYMYYLLENYQTNPDVKYLVDNLELYFVPCVNPDGYTLNATTDPNGGGMHRKNCRQTGASNYGIDLNRNYGYNWGYDNTGSSPNIEDETYRGTAGFSEAETQAMKAFAENKLFKLVIDYHCYSNVLLYPWGYADLITPDNTTFRAFSALMTRMNGFFYGTAMEGIGYTANGGSFDWFYGEQTSKPKIIAWSPEAGNVNDGFYPASNRIETIAKTFMEMNLYVARFALKYADISDSSSRFIQSGNYLKYSLYNVGMDTPTDITFSLIPVSSQLQSTAPSKTYSNLSFLQQVNDSFPVQVDANTLPGTVLKYVYKVETSQGYYYSDTFSVVYGNPLTLFTENGNSMTQWTSTTWGTTSTSYHSSPKSITDSPSGDYPENSTRTITQNQSVSLSNTVYAELSFWTKWDIEPLVDYVQVQISTDNGSTWLPLCGQYTEPSFVTSTLNQPIYSGMRSEWVHERMSLNDYLGQSIKLRMKLVSGFSYNMQNDGLYVDDMLIQVIPTPSSVQENTTNSGLLNVYPNPATDVVHVNYLISGNDKNAEINVVSMLGKLIKTIPLDPTKHEISFSLNNQKGLFLIKLCNSSVAVKPVLVRID
jgi:murein tripeptide amidase MpaA